MCATDGLVTDVLVVGAGPTGLMAANCLTRLNVGVIIMDGKDGPTRQSRALGVQARTMEIYDQLGMIDAVLAESYTADAIVPGFGKKVFHPVSLVNLGRTLSPYPRLYVLEQSRNERLLVEHLAGLGVDVGWNSSLTSLELVPDAVHPVRAGFANGKVISARYCIGADGASSQVRRLRHIAFAGKTNQHSFYVCDATGVAGLAADRINLRFADTDFLLTFPMGPDNHQRLLGIVRTPDVGATVLEQSVRERLRDVFGVSYGTSTWFATYRLHHRIADRFREGPIFLAGDAAHVHSPVGAQGMNTGLQDAHNLATKLADVCQGRAGGAYLDRYQAERRPVAEKLVSTTDRLFEGVTSEKPVPRLLRRTLIPLVAPIATRGLPRLPGASRIFGYVSQTRIRYGMAERQDRRDRVLGRRLPWTGENYACLRSMTWQVHSYSSSTAARAAEIGEQLGLSVCTFTAVGRTKLRPDHLYLVRPDGFVAAHEPEAGALTTFTQSMEALLAPGGPGS